MLHRVMISVVLAVLAASLLVSGPIEGAYADFAADCAAPSRTLSGGGGASIRVAPGETMLLTGGTFTGGVDAFPAGSQLCVSGSASLAPGYLNNAAGALDVAPGGTVNFPSISVTTGFSLEDSGSVRFAGLNINGAANIHNLAAGTMTVTGQFSPSAARSSTTARSPTTIAGLS